jgi:hypothetical protein
LKYLYTPYDIALFFNTSDLKESEKDEVIDVLYSNDAILLPKRYRADRRRFHHEIAREQAGIEGTEDELEQLLNLLKDTKYDYGGNDNDEKIVESFFKQVELQLMFTKKTYRKIKLRRLLAEFGYRKRSKPLVRRIKRTMYALSIDAFTRGGEACDIATVDIDSMISFRLSPRGRQIDE